MLELKFVLLWKSRLDAIGFRLVRHAEESKVHASFAGAAQAFIANCASWD
jgi:hypothetical protein